jgi:hypothetical protein
MRRLRILLPLLLCYAALAFGVTTITTTQSQIPNGPGVAQVGVVYDTQLSATGFTGTLTWTIAAGQLPPSFVLDQFQGIICTGTVTAGVATCGAQATTPGAYTFTVSAADSGTGGTASKQFSISVLAAGAPSITSGSVLPNAVAGQSYSFTFTETGGQTPYQWTEASASTVYPPFFSLNGATGVFSNPDVTGSGTYTFAIQVKDANNLASTKLFTLTISQSGLEVINTSPLASGAVNVPYNNGNGVQLQAVGGTSYTWSQIGGSLPPGLALGSTGLISGTPTANGTYPFEVEVIGAGVTQGQDTATANFTISIESSQLAITTTSLPFAIQNAAYSTTITATGGVPPYQWALGADNVVGLSIDPNLGILSGAPSSLAGGSYSIQVIVKDAAGNTYSVTYPFTIASNLTISTTSLPNGTLGQNYSAMVSAAGGQAPYTWSLSGSLPPGLNFGNSAGSTVTISGPATTNGSYQFSLKVVDSGGRTATQQFTILIGSTLSITTTSLPAGAQGATYNQVLGAMGGQQPYTWSVTSGSLPAGLTLSTNPDSTATINGNPTGQGPSTFTLQVKDSQGNLATQTYSINIGVPLLITTVVVSNATVGLAYSAPLGANGGTAPYTWSLVSGTLPPGITLNSSNGLLSGTPLTPGSYNFTVNVADSSSATAQRAYSITVLSGLTLQGGNATGTAGTAFSFSVSATGGVPPYSYSISGSLPAGVTFSNSISNQFGGTPTAAGTSSVSVTVTDASGATATASVSFNISLPAVPTVTIGAISPTLGTQPALSLRLSSAFPVAVNGTLALTFSGSDGTVGFTNGSQSVQFTIAANSTTATFTGCANCSVVLGTTAGTITLSVTQLTVNGTSVIPSPAPQIQVVIPPLPPVISSVTCAAATGSFTVSVTGYTPTHSMASGTFTFTAPAGSTIASSSTSTQVAVASAFTTWFATAGSASTGGQFLLTMPFTTSSSGSSAGIGVSVALGNSVGGSNSMSATCK